MKNPSRLLIVFMSLFILNCGADYDALYRKGMDLKKSGNFEKSLESFKRASEKKATPEIFKEIGNIYIEYYRNYDLAEQFLKKSLEIDPEYPNAIHNMGLINIKRYEESLQSKPSPEYLNEAEKWLSRNLKTHEDFALSYAEYGMVLFHKGQFNEAMKSIDQAISKGVNKSYASLLQGKIYFFGYRNYREALSRFNSAYNDFSNDSYLLRMIALSHKELQEFPQARNYYKKYIKSLEEMGAGESLIKKAVEEESSIPAG